MGMGSCVSVHDKENDVSISVNENGVSRERGNGRSILVCATCRKGTLVYKSILRQHLQVESRKARGLIDFFRYL
jgi:hypothetical protein